MNEFLELFDYNAWANRTIFDAVARLPDELYVRDLRSSHGGIHGTLAHLVWVEQLYLHRWLGRPNPAVAQGADLKTLAEVRERWEAVEAERGTFFAAFNPKRLDEMIRVQPSAGGEFAHSFRQMFHHCTHHSSYHRGQVVTLLRQLGAKPPSTDLILYYRR